MALFARRAADEAVCRAFLACYGSGVPLDAHFPRAAQLAAWIETITRQGIRNRLWTACRLQGYIWSGDSMPGMASGAGKHMTRAFACRIVTILFVVVLACSSSAVAAVGAPARGPENVAIISVQGIPERAQSAAASGGSPTCFRSGAETNCVSGNPDLSVGFASNGDTTGCTFDLEIQWDDSATTSDPVDGGPDGTPFGPYDHAYAKPGIYTVDWSSTVTANTGLNNCGDSSGTYSFTYFPCLQEGKTNGVTLPAITERAGPVKQLSPFISYGKLPLTFTSVAPTADSVCTVRSNEGSMPVSIFGATVDSTTTATVEFLPANDPGTQVPACTFAGLQGLANVTVTRRQALSMLRTTACSPPLPMTRTA